MASSSTASGSSAPPINDRDVAIEANNFMKELEVERIIKSFKLNPYDVLDLPFDVSESEIKKQYRKKSLMIHPDKFKHDRGVEAFDWLKKAEGSLSTTESRASLDEVILFARRTLFKAFTPPLPNTTLDSDPALPGDWRLRVLKEVRDILIDEEVARRKAIKMTLANEGLEAQKKDEEINARKRKKEAEKNWEENRDARLFYEPHAINFTQKTHASRHHRNWKAGDFPFSLSFRNSNSLSLDPPTLIVSLAMSWNNQPPQQPYYPPYQGGPPQPQYNNQGPPPQQQWNGGPPPSNQYGAPPPQQGYGQQQQQQQYPQQGYPQQQQNQQYPPQQAQAGGLWYLGTEIVPLEGMGLPMPYPVQNYNPQFDADRIRKATKGFGTDEKAMIAVLAPLTASQMHALGKSFEAQVGRTLIDVIEKETKGDFEFALRGLALGPLGWDLWLVDRACKGFGTHEDLLTELLMTRTNLEIHTLKQAYKALLGSDVTNLVKGELSSKTERIFLMALAGQRDESGFINQQQVTNDVQELYKGGAGRMGTDEIKLASVMITRSPPHLAAVSREYHSRHGKTLSQAIDSEFGGHMKDALLYIAEAAERDGQGVDRDAIMIERAMAGMGTKDERLTWRIIRGHWDKPRWAAVKAAYQRMYGKSMASRVKGETTGDLENILVAVIG